MGLFMLPPQFRPMKRSAPVLGALAQAAVFAVLLVAIRPPLYAYLATSAVAGVVEALLSDRFQEEFVDAGAAGLIGTMLSIGVALVSSGATPRRCRSTSSSIWPF